MPSSASRPLRRALAAAFLVVLVPVLAACGFREQTDLVYQPSDGVNNRSGQVDVLGAVVVSGLDGQGTLVASLANKNQNDTETLTSVTPGDSNAGLTTRLATPVQVGPGDLVNLADSGAISVTGAGITPGKFARLDLKFQSGQEVDLNVPIVDQSGWYSDIEPADPSPSATPTPAP
jgi:hypothetical protein